MMVTIYTSECVTVGAAAYQRARAQAEAITQQQRAAGQVAHCRWDDDFNDYSARGRFVVTGRA